jgi:hypothetical protein
MSYAGTFKNDIIVRKDKDLYEITYCDISLWLTEDEAQYVANKLLELRKGGN